MTANAVFDDDGILVFLDGIMRDVTSEIEGKEGFSTAYKMLDILNGFMVILNLDGELIDINDAGVINLGYNRGELVGKLFSELTVKKDKDFFQPLFSNILKTGREDIYLSLVDKERKELPVEFHASLIRKLEKPDHIKGIARFVEGIEEGHREITAKGKLQGVLEMAGGVAHRLNQPLTVINNLLNEVLSESGPEDRNYEKIVKIHDQLQKLNEIAKKIREVKKYESMEYVGGIKIVDIDKSS
jgi:PAS domain S-box-containing protein